VFEEEIPSTADLLGNLLAAKLQASFVRSDQESTFQWCPIACVQVLPTPRPRAWWAHYQQFRLNFVQEPIYLFLRFWFEEIPTLFLVKRYALLTPFLGFQSESRWRKQFSYGKLRVCAILNWFHLGK
jgi:hypothetical protein